jgi:hypothetical protein
MTGFASKRLMTLDKMSFLLNIESDSARKTLNITTPWKRRPKADNEALANAINIWSQPVYQPPKDEYVRPGALDFKKVKSK